MYKILSKLDICLINIIFNSIIIFIESERADYHVIASVTYRANGVVSQSCLPMYQDLMIQHYTNLNAILTERCSNAVNVNMNVSFVKSLPSLTEQSIVKVREKLY